MTRDTNPASASSPVNIFDVSGLADLKRQAKAGDPAANKVVAKQFEALFLQMVLKSMRDATPSEGLFDSEQTRMYESLLDQQLGQALGGSTRGTGLAAMIEAQLARQNPDLDAAQGALPLRPAAPGFALPPGNKFIPLPAAATPSFSAQSLSARPVYPQAPVTAAARLDTALPSSGFGHSLRPDSKLSGVSPAPTFSSPASPAADGTQTMQQAFVHRLLPAAVSAGQTTGVPAHFMVAQAALETGWGKFEPKHADGRPSFNLFGIKAGASWTGPAVEAVTTEVVAGVAQRRIERFRAYASYAEAMGDYAQLITDQPRYAAVLAAREPAQFARSLQAAGFATDPGYAAKLERIITGDVMKKALAG